MRSSRAKAPQARSSATTRQALLAAAHSRFLKESYDNVGLRDIAGDAGVDVALVNRYFGSKEDLFREVLGTGERGEILPPGLSNSEIASLMARMFVEEGGSEGNAHVERLLIVLRSASSVAASRVVRETLREDILAPLAERLGGTRPELRASTSMAVWMGMTIMRTIMTIEPLCEPPVELEARLRQLFEAALAENGAADSEP